MESTWRVTLFCRILTDPAWSRVENQSAFLGVVWASPESHAPNSNSDPVPYPTRLWCAMWITQASRLCLCLIILFPKIPQYLTYFLYSAKNKIKHGCSSMYSFKTFEILKSLNKKTIYNLDFKLYFDICSAWHKYLRCYRKQYR